MLRKVEVRARRSRHIKVELRRLLQSHEDVPVETIRQLVGQAVGCNLEAGEKRLFFDRQLYKLTRHIPAAGQRQARGRYHFDQTLPMRAGARK